VCEFTFGTIWAKFEKSLLDGIVKDKLAMEEPRAIWVTHKIRRRIMCTYSNFWSVFKEFFVLVVHGHDDEEFGGAGRVVMDLTKVKSLGSQVAAE
jgi:hypothetical protein